MTESQLMKRELVAIAVTYVAVTVVIVTVKKRASKWFHNNFDN